MKLSAEAVELFRVIGFDPLVLRLASEMPDKAIQILLAGALLQAGKPGSPNERLIQARLVSKTLAARVIAERLRAKADGNGETKVEEDEGDLLTGLYL